MFRIDQDLAVPGTVGPRDEITVGYRTRLEQVTVRDVGSFTLETLADRQQYWDPHGQAERLGISEALWPLFGMLWPSSIHLSAHIAVDLKAQPSVDTERILEIGCGLALVSLVAHSLGADITASDCHPLTGHFLQTNLCHNELAPTLPYRHGQWGLDEPVNEQDASGPLLADQKFDWVVASDVLYERDSAVHVADFIAQHCEPEARAWVVDANRGYRPALNRRMASHGFELEDDVTLQESEAVEPGARPYRGRLVKYRRHA